MMPPPALEAAEETRAVEVSASQNVIVARAHGHARVSLLQDGREIVAEHSGEPRAAFVVEPGTYEVRTDGTLEDVEAQTVELAATPGEHGTPRLRLSADAPDRHTVDGVGEIPADGRSSCTVTVERTGPDGRRLTGREGAVEVFLRTTGGRIMDSRGRRRIRSVRLRAGRATFRLVSEEFPRLVSIHAFERGGSDAELPLEFI